MSLLWRIETSDGSVCRTLKPCETQPPLSVLVGDKPKDISRCVFRLINWKLLSNLLETSEDLFSTYFSSKDFSGSGEIPITIGVSCVTEFDRLLDLCLQNMVVNEVADFEIESSKLKIKAELSLKLESFENSREIFEIPPEKILEVSSKLKQEGVTLYNQQRIPEAFYKFSKALKLLFLLDDKDESVKSLSTEKGKLITHLSNNLAGCHIKNNNFAYAVELCDAVLKLDSDNVKAYFRRGISYMELQEFEKARNDFLKVKSLEPDNTLLKRNLDLLSTREHSLNKKYANTMKKMFYP